MARSCTSSGRSHRLLPSLTQHRQASWEVLKVARSKFLSDETRRRPSANVYVAFRHSSTLSLPFKLRPETTRCFAPQDEPNRGALPTPSDAPVTPSPTKGTRPKRDEAPSTSKELPPLSGSTRRSGRTSRDENAQRIAGRYPSSGPDAVVANATEGPEPFQGRPLPVVNLSNIPTNRHVLIHTCTLLPCAGEVRL